MNSQHRGLKKVGAALVASRLARGAAIFGNPLQVAVNLKGT